MRSLHVALVALALLVAAAAAEATYTQQYTLSQDAAFLQQVTVAEIQTSVAVLAEAATTSGHLQRAAFAQRVIQDPTKWAPIIAIVVASQNNNPMTPLTTPSTVADSLVQTAMNAQWTNMAGYFAQ